MVSLFSAFSKIKQKKILVIGDFVLDTYTIGKVKRISPEAPVAVLHVHHEEHRPGMAGNVALNLISMGAKISVAGRIGLDNNGQILREELEKEGIETNGLIVQQGYFTPIKNRIIADNQQIVRVDREDACCLPEFLEQQIIDSFPQLFQDVALVAISDYGKGFVSKTLVASLTRYARKKQIPVIVDPKGLDFTKYTGVDLLKPNLSELYAAANLSSDASLDFAAKKILDQTAVGVLMVTRSEQGISLFYKDGRREDFAVRVQQVKDVTGAGDTVLAMLSNALANGLTEAEGAQLSNIAAGVAIERFGCARVSLSEIARRLLSEDIVNKFFDKQHLFVLQEALKDRKCVILSLSCKENFTSQMFSVIHQLSQKDNWDLLVHIQEIDPDPEFISLLASLHDIDYIIIKNEGLQNLCNLINPEEIYLFKDQKIKQIEEFSSAYTEVSSKFDF